MRKLLWILGAVAATGVAMGATVRMTQMTPAKAGPPAASVQSDGFPLASPIAANGAAHWSPVWTRPAPNLRDVSLSPGGDSVAFVDGAGQITRLAASDGKTAWQTGPKPGINTVRAANGGSVVAFSRYNPARPQVQIVSGPNAVRSIAVEGAVWNALPTRDGSAALVTTGRAQVYRIPLAPPASPAANPPATIRLSGIADALAVTDAPLTLIATTALSGATSAGAGVGVWGMDGTPRWQHEEEQTDRTYQVQMSRDGATAAVLSARGPRKIEPRLDVWDARTGRLLFIEKMDATGFDPRVWVSANGRSIAVSYSRLAAYNSGTRLEKRMSLFDREGRRLIRDKGGVFFAPDVVCLSPDGSRLTVEDGDGSLWTLDSRGRTLSRLHVPAVPNRDGVRPQNTLATPDGTFILMYRTDGKFDPVSRPVNSMPATLENTRLTQADALQGDINAFVRNKTGDFDALCRRVFTYQFTYCEPLRRFWQGRGATPDTVAGFTEIPPAPAAAFKRFDLSAAPVRECVPENGGVTFHSSGTTGNETSRHYLDTAAASVYRATLQDGFTRFVCADGYMFPIYALMPPPTDLPHSSLSFMLHELIRVHGGQFFFGEQWQQRLTAVLRRLKTPVVVFGTAFAWVHFFDSTPDTFALPRGSRVVETGGFKGRSREVSPPELYEMLTLRLGVSKARSVSEYGMSEMASQFYDSTLYDAAHGLARPPRKIGPHYLKTRIIDPQTGDDAAPGEAGLLAHYDLGNLNSCVALQTEDMGRWADDGHGFHLLGRAPGAILRGCSLTSEELHTAFTQGA